MPVLVKKMIVFTKMPLNDWNMLLEYDFMSKLLETPGDDLLYSSKTFFKLKNTMFLGRKNGVLFL